MFEIKKIVDMIQDMYNSKTENISDIELFILTMHSQSRNEEIYTFMLKYYTKPYGEPNSSQQLLNEHRLLVEKYQSSEIETINKSEGTIRWNLFIAVFEYFKQCQELDGNGVKEGLDPNLFINIYRRLLGNHNLKLLSK